MPSPTVAAGWSSAVLRVHLEMIKDFKKPQPKGMQMTDQVEAVAMDTPSSGPSENDLVLALLLDGRRPLLLGQEEMEEQAEEEQEGECCIPVLLMAKG